MKQIIPLLIFIFATPFLCTAGKNAKYPAYSIPTELSKNADAVIRNYSIVINIISETKIVTEETYVVTIFNKKAQNLGYFSESYDGLNSITNYELIYYNQLGIQTAKAKKSDFKDISGYDGFSLYDDQRVVYYKAMSNNYPYTIAYKVTHTSNQSLFIGNWFPVNNYNVAVEHSRFEVISDDTTSYRYYALNMPDQDTLIFKENKWHREWQLNDFKSIEKEPFSPDFYSIVPSVRIAPNQFDYDGHKGDFTSWNTFGMWIWDLIKDRDELDKETQEKIDVLLATCTNDDEKIKVLYKYLQNNTRYVNVSLGIGGFQPFSASTVDENKYGDCKALSNYMRSMLKHAGIESNYIVIKSGESEHIIPEFPSQQMNHIILCVPNKGDSIWLECTSQKIPFGYISKSNHDKTVLLISEDGGKLVKTPKYDKEQNTQYRQIKASMDSLGNIKLNSNTNYVAIQYENVNEYFYLSKEEQKEALYKDLEIPRMNVNSFEFSRNNKPIPEAKSSLDLSINKYAKASGTRLIVIPNILNQWGYIPNKVKERKLPIVSDMNFQDADTVYIDFPSTMEVEYLPKNIDIKNEFGQYHSTFTQKKHQIVYTRHLSMGDIIYPKEKYDEFRSFLKQVAKADQSKVIFNKAL